MPETQAALSRDPSVLRAKRIELFHHDFAGAWRGMEREKFMELTGSLLPDAVLIVWKIRVHDVTLSELTADEWLKGVPRG